MNSSTKQPSDDPLFRVTSTNDPPTPHEHSLATKRMQEIDSSLGQLHVGMNTLTSQINLLCQEERKLAETWNPSLFVTATGIEPIAMEPDPQDPALVPLAEHSPSNTASCPEYSNPEGCDVDDRVGPLKELGLKYRSLQSQREALDSQLDQLLHEELGLLKAKEDCSCVLSPWRGLPSEILSEIIQAAVNPKSYLFLSSTHTGPDRKHFKDIRAVCRLWREVAFATKSLWTSVYVDFDQYQPDQIPGLVRSIASYFKRAGPTLRITIGFHWCSLGPTPGEEGYDFGAWLDFLSSQRSRWEEVTISCQPYRLQLFLRMVRKDFESGAVEGPWNTWFLQMCTNPYGDRLPEQNEVVESKVFQECFPELETINLNVYGDGLISQGEAMLLDPHPGLRKLRLDVYNDFNPYFIKLGGFSNLRKLIIHFTDADIPLLHKEAPVHHFQQLELLVISRASTFSFLNNFRTPSLRTLQILAKIPRGYHIPDLSDTFMDLVHFVGKYDQTLREVHLRHFWFLEGDELFLRLLGALPSVKKLCVDTWLIGRQGEETLGSTHHHPGAGLAETEISSTRSCLPNLHSFCMHTQDERILVRQRADAGTHFAGQHETNGSIILNEDLRQSPLSVRPPFSWPLLDEFLKSGINKRRDSFNSGSTKKLSGTDIDGPKFSVSIAPGSCDAGGEVAISLLGYLESDGVRVHHDKFCSVYW